MKYWNIWNVESASPSIDPVALQIVLWNVLYSDFQIFNLYFALHLFYLVNIFGCIIRFWGQKSALIKIGTFYRQ